MQPMGCLSRCELIEILVAYCASIPANFLQKIRGWSNIVPALASLQKGLERRKVARDVVVEALLALPRLPHELLQLTADYNSRIHIDCICVYSCSFFL